MSHHFCLYICPNICMCVVFPFISTLLGGGIKAYFKIVQPDLGPQIGPLSILGFTLLILRGGINP